MTSVRQLRVGSGADAAGIAGEIDTVGKAGAVDIDGKPAQLILSGKPARLAQSASLDYFDLSLYGLDIYSLSLCIL